VSLPVPPVSLLDLPEEPSHHPFHCWTCPKSLSRPVSLLVLYGKRPSLTRFTVGFVRKEVLQPPRNGGILLKREPPSLPETEKRWRKEPF